MGWAESRERPVERQGESERARPMIVIARAILIATITGVALTALTGYGGHLLDDHPSGWVLLAHMAASPLVLLGLAAVALLWGRRHRFDADNDVAGVTKLLFWVFLICGLASAASMLAAMLPVFGYIGQDRLLIIHEWSGIGLIAAGVLYCVCSRVCGKNGRTKQHAS